MRSVFALVVGAFGLFAPVLVDAQSRPLRLFFATVGLSNPAVPTSPAANPESELGANPVVAIAPGSAVRLYVWAQITPPGTPNSATYNGISLRATVSGAGGQIAGMSFWNYSNASYSRWSSLGSFYDNPQQVRMNGSAVLAGSGVTNSNTANLQDAQYKRWNTGSTVRIDCTLLGWVEITGATPGLLNVNFSIGQFGVSQVGQGVQPVYLGWGDEQNAPLSTAIGASSPLPDATIQVGIPEPSALALMGVAAAAMLRRR